MRFLRENKLTATSPMHRHHFQTESSCIVLVIINVSLFSSTITELFKLAASCVICSLKRGQIHKPCDLPCTAPGSACSLSSGEFGIVSDNHSTCLSTTMALESIFFIESKVIPRVVTGVFRKWLFLFGQSGLL